MKNQPWIVSRRGVQGGKPYIRGTRITVDTIREVADDWPEFRILMEYPSLTSESLAAVMEYIRSQRKGKAGK